MPGTHSVKDELPLTVTDGRLLKGNRYVLRWTWHKLYDFGSRYSTGLNRDAIASVETPGRIIA